MSEFIKIEEDGLTDHYQCIKELERIIYSYKKQLVNQENTIHKQRERIHALEAEIEEFRRARKAVRKVYLGLEE